MPSRLPLPLRSVRPNPPRLSLRLPTRSLATIPPPPPPNESKYKTALTPLRAALIGIFTILGSTSFGYMLHDHYTRSTTSTSYLQTHLIPSALAKELQSHNQPKYGTHSDYLSAISELEGIFEAKGKKDRVSVDDADLETHGVSEWSYHSAKKPTVVVWVDSTEEVQEIVRVANKWRVPITPFSGGTSLEGHFSSPYGGISLDMSLMDTIIRISESDGDVTLQPGVKWEDLNAHLKSLGIPLFFPLDPGPGATIGGMIGTGCSGTNAVRYGTAKGEWFLNATVVLPSGEIIKTRSRARKSSAGFDATKIFIGAEGTLGIVTEATLRLAPLLPTKCAVVTFEGVEEAVRAATEVVNAGFPVQCVEYLDTLTMRAINAGGLAGRQYTPAETLFFKFQGSPESMAEVAKQVQKVTKKHGGRNFEFSKSQEEAERLWQGRKAALWSVLALKEGARVWTTDVCVPISKLPTLVKETREDFERRGITACHFGHVGDGNCHSLALFSDDTELAIVKDAVHEMVERAIRLEGTCTGEHGVGVGKVEYLETELGVGTVNLMETLKRTIDPLNLFNPGKIYPNIKPVIG